MLYISKVIITTYSNSLNRKAHADQSQDNYLCQNIFAY